jgi:PPP family 3-phenylpropionic acid transporter
MLSGLAYGLLAAAYKTYIYDLAPDKYKISCLSLSESIIGLSGVISAPVFGFVIMKFGTYASIAMGLAIDVAAAIAIAVSMLKEREKQQNNLNIIDDSDAFLE